MHGNELLQYRLLYARWLLYCDFPEKHPALPRYSPTKVFGRDFATLVGPMLVFRLQKVNSQAADKAALLLQDFLDYLVYSRITVTKKKKIIRFHDGNNLLEGCSLIDYDPDSSNDSALSMDQNLPLNGTELNGTYVNGSPHSSPKSPPPILTPQQQQQRKNSTSNKTKARKSTQNSMDSNPNSPENLQHQPTHSNFVRKLSANTLRSAFRQMHMEDCGSSREDC